MERNSDKDLYGMLITCDNDEKRDFRARLCCLINKRDNFLHNCGYEWSCDEDTAVGDLKKVSRSCWDLQKKCTHAHAAAARYESSRVSFMCLICRFFSSRSILLLLFFSHTTQEFILEGKSLSGSAIELCSSVMSHQAQEKRAWKALRRII